MKLENVSSTSEMKAGHMVERTSIKIDVVTAKAITASILQNLKMGTHQAPVHLKDYALIARLIVSLAPYDLGDDATPELRAHQSVLFSLSRGEPGRFKTWTEVTVERLNALGRGSNLSESELEEVKLYLAEFKLYLAELNSSL